MGNTVRLSEAAAGTLLAAKPASSKPERAKSLAVPETRLDQIRRAGCALLFRSGYSGMTMRQIAASLKIKAASLYYYFPSKQHILFDVMHSTVQELLAGLREIAGSEDEPEAQLDRAIRWHVLYHTSKREEAFVSHSELRSLEPENLRTILKLRREYERLFDAILKRGLRQGAFHTTEPSVVRNCILTMCTSTAGWFSAQGPLAAEEVAAEISRFVHAALVKENCKGDAAAISGLEPVRESRPSPASHP
jgi:AcrR family transcriptional regulator